jgi:hypothetical protein
MDFTSTDYDVTPGAFQTTKGGGGDVFVTKLNAAGTALVYSTYIGGSSGDDGHAIAVDGSGNAYVTGYTSPPTTMLHRGLSRRRKEAGGCFCDEAECGGHRSGLFHLHRGECDDEGYAIAVDGSGNAYVTGGTTSTDYDVTPGAFQTTK